MTLFWMRSAGDDALRAADLDAGLRRAAEGARGIDHVVEQDAGLALDITDEVHDLGMVGLFAALIDDREAQTHLHGELTRARHAAHIGRDHDHVLVAVAEAAQIVRRKDRRAEEVVHGDIEEALDLRCVQVHREHTVSARLGDEVCHELGRDRITRLGLAVLTGVAEIRDDGGDAAGGGALHRVDHDEQLHETVVHGLAGRLHDEHIRAAHGLFNADGALAVGKLLDGAAPHRRAEILADQIRKRRIGVSGEDFDLFAV